MNDHYLTRFQLLPRRMRHVDSVVNRRKTFQWLSHLSTVHFVSPVRRVALMWVITIMSKLRAEDMKQFSIFEKKIPIHFISVIGMIYCTCACERILMIHNFRLNRSLCKTLNWSWSSEKKNTYLKLAKYNFFSWRK
jgi:hypothetical protein